jgi:site-specific DNA-methyltransferase (adenine-specific)
MNIDLRLGDCIEILKTLPDNSVDSIVTDPPYGIGFMNKEWDSPQKHKELIEREIKRSQERFEEGKSPAKGGFSKGVQPGLPIGGAKEGRWFQEWCEQWAVECFRVLKPGGHLLSFSSPRTYHRMATAFEDSGFQIRDQIMWVFGSGFPKSHNIGKAIDKIQGNEREVVGQVERKDFTNYDGSMMDVDNRGKHISIEIPITKGQSDYEGWGTALKPAHEPICMARKPLTEKSIAENVLKWGTGGINIDDCRIEFEDTPNAATNPKFRKENNYKMPEPGQESNGVVKFTSSKNEYDSSGRFPANIMFDEEAGDLLDQQSDKASRFFYCPKVSKKERNMGMDVQVGVFHQRPRREDGTIIYKETHPDEWKEAMDKLPRKDKTSKAAAEEKLQGEKGNVHPTVKPIKLMEYLIKLVTPKGGVVLEPFMGSGSTGIAAKNLGFSFIGIEKEQEYFDIAQKRIGI